MENNFCPTKFLSSGNKFVPDCCIYMKNMPGKNTEYCGPLHLDL